MANATFYLRKGNDKTEQPIYLRYRITPAIDFKYPIKIKVLPKHWDTEKERVKNVIAVPERQTINEYLNELVQAVDGYKIRTVARKETITATSLRDFLNEYLTPINANEKTFWGYFEAYIEKLKGSVNAKTGKQISRYTSIRAKKLRELLKAFEKTEKREITFETFDLDFHTKFTGFLTKRGYSINTIGNVIKALKTVLNSATERGINKNVSYKSARFTAMSEDSENIYLSETELGQMADLDLSENKRLERVRDLFLLGAYTGLRFSDFTRITPENIENGTIKIHQKKTGGKVVIPLHAVVKRIFEQYRGEAPKVISSQKMNEYLKEIGQKIPSLLERVSKTITKGGKQVTEHYSKWELLSTHTARRSFATNLFKTGFPAQSIMQITGHRTEKAFLKYIKVTQEEHAERLAEHWKRNTKMRLAQ